MNNQLIYTLSLFIFNDYRSQIFTRSFYILSIKKKTMKVLFHYISRVFICFVENQILMFFRILWELLYVSENVLKIITDYFSLVACPFIVAPVIVFESWSTFLLLRICLFLLPKTLWNELETSRISENCSIIEFCK